MTPLVRAKLILAVVGIVLFGYGMRISSRPVSWAGIAVLGAAALMRFAGPRRRDDS